MEPLLGRCTTSTPFPTSPGSLHLQIYAINTPRWRTCEELRQVAAEILSANLPFHACSMADYKPRVMQRLIDEASLWWCRSCELCPTGPTSLQPDEARCAEYAPDLPHLNISRLMGLTQPQVSPSCPSTPIHPFPPRAILFPRHPPHHPGVHSRISLLRDFSPDSSRRTFDRLQARGIPAVDQPSGQGHRNQLTYPTACPPSPKPATSIDAATQLSTCLSENGS
ncbi:hypothetical protein GE09DRAFT_4172 [Coniochaeta sp. 2T2.1]|nr:hypothetical protein GE09DRAFT_4172 [Coniochaeta sp. 2T2.1]